MSIQKIRPVERYNAGFAGPFRRVRSLMREDEDAGGVSCEGSFRGARNLEPGIEIPRRAIAHLRSGPEPVIGRRKAPTRWDHPDDA